MHVQNKDIKEKADANKILKDKVFKTITDQSCHVSWRGSSKENDVKT